MAASFLHRKRSPSKRKRDLLLKKRIYPKESKFFPSGVDPIEQGSKHENRVASPESVPIHLKLPYLFDYKTGVSPLQNDYK